MNKTISASKLKTLESSGARVRRPIKEPQSPEAPEPAVKTLVPTNPQPAPEVLAMATATLERTEQMLSTSIVTNEGNMRELVDALRTALADNARTSDPVPYEVDVVRRRDGLIDKFRITPVKPNLH